MPTGQLGFFTVDPATGKITYDFKGHISALGMDMLVTSPPDSPFLSTDRKLRWHNATFTDTVIRGDIFTGDDGADAYMMLNTYNVPQTLTTRLTVQQAPGAGSAATSIQVQTDIGSGSSRTAVILDGLNRSSFLKLLTLANLRIAFGQTSVGPTTSVDVNIGLAPVNVQLTIRAIGFPGGLSALNYDYQGANVIRIYNNNGFVIPFDWLAVG